MIKPLTIGIVIGVSLGLAVAQRFGLDGIAEQLIVCVFSGLSSGIAVAFYKSGSEQQS